MNRLNLLRSLNPAARLILIRRSSYGVLTGPLEDDQRALHAARREPGARLAATPATRGQHPIRELVNVIAGDGL